MNKKVTNLSETEKAEALKVIGAELAKLDRKHGEAVVKWAVNCVQKQKAERVRLKKEKADLERRLAEIGAP